VSRARLLTLSAAVAAVLAAGIPAAYAVRANWGVRRDGPLLEQAGRHEEAAFYYRAALDFWSVIQQLWMEAVYDPRVDEIYRDYVRIFGTDGGYRAADHEEWQDNEEGCLLFFNRDGAARNVEKGRLSPEARARLEDRLRVYIEDMIDPDYGFGGDFSFSRKARVLEGTGLFWHAALRRELAGRYAIRVCSRYYAAIADELERVFNDPARAKLYREKAAWWRTRGIEELHLANGDRALARLAGGGRSKKLSRQEVVDIAKQALRGSDPDARKAAAALLAEPKPSPLAEAIAATPGVRFEYFSRSAQDKPVVAKVLPNVDLGLKLQANFPRVWYGYWEKPEVFPADAQGPFLLKITGKLYVPADGQYRFYAKVDAPHRASVSVETAPGQMTPVISPRNEKALQFVEQIGMPTHRIDFSQPVLLKKGLVALAIEYAGQEVRKTHDEHIVRISGVQHAGVQLYWSSDQFLTELVPEQNLFH